MKLLKYLLLASLLLSACTKNNVDENKKSHPVTLIIEQDELTTISTTNSDKIVTGMIGEEELIDVTFKYSIYYETNQIVIESVTYDTKDDNTIIKGGYWEELNVVCHEDELSYWMDGYVKYDKNGEEKTEYFSMCLYFEEN